jgi:hypothetical protein
VRLRTVNDTIIAYGTALIDDDQERFGTVEALPISDCRLPCNTVYLVFGFGSEDAGTSCHPIDQP